MDKLKKTLNDFIDKCIPLMQEKDNHIYFISDSYQLYGFDIVKNALFEPSSVNKYNLIKSSMDFYFTDDTKNDFEEKTGIKFNELEELTLKINYRDKYIGRRFYYSKSNKRIYIWSLITRSWEKADVDSLRSIFTNNELFLDYETIKKSDKTKSLEELGVEFEDLQEISMRFRDASIHYYHKKQNKIYSLSILNNCWYVPDDTVQKQILEFVNNESKNESASI